MGWALSGTQYESVSAQACLADGDPALAGLDRWRLCVVAPLQFCRWQNNNGAAQNSAFPCHGSAFGAPATFRGAAPALPVLARDGEGVGQNREPADRGQGC